MEKVIIHNKIGNISYAFTVAEMAYRNFIDDNYDNKRTFKKEYKFHDGISATAYRRDKCVTIIVDYKGYLNN